MYKKKKIEKKKKTAGYGFAEHICESPTLDVRFFFFFTFSISIAVLSVFYNLFLYDFYVTRELRVTCLKLQLEFKVFVDFHLGQMFQRNEKKKQKKSCTYLCHFACLKWSWRP